MSDNTSEDDDLRRLIAEAKRASVAREQGFRARALRLFPPICAKCGREFGGAQLSELTVHHRDHNHDNNPSDGSNWELLCVYCHGQEHSRQDVAREVDRGQSEESLGDSTYQPFAGLDLILKKARDNDD